MSDFTVYLEPNATTFHIARLCDWVKAAHRRGVIEGLARIPWPSGLFCFALEVASGHVDTDTEAPNAVHSGFKGNIGSAFSESNDQFDLVMDILGLIWAFNFVDMLSMNFYLAVRKTLAEICCD